MKKTCLFELLNSNFSFWCFLCSWILFPCFYLDNNYSVLFLILLPANDSLPFMINSISCSKFSSTILGESKLKWKVLGSFITIIFSSIAILTWLICCKPFWWFYNAHAKDTVFAWFNFLVSMNSFQLCFVLIISDFS